MYSCMLDHYVIFFLKWSHVCSHYAKKTLFVTNISDYLAENVHVTFLACQISQIVNSVLVTPQYSMEKEKE